MAQHEANRVVVESVYCSLEMLGADAGVLQALRPDLVAVKNDEVAFSDRALLVAFERALVQGRTNQRKPLGIPIRRVARPLVGSSA